MNKFEEGERVTVARILDGWGDPYGTKGKVGKVLRCSGEWYDFVADGDEDRDYVCVHEEELDPAPPKAPEGKKNLKMIIDVRTRAT